ANQRQKLRRTFWIEVGKGRRFEQCESLGGAYRRFAFMRPFRFAVFEKLLEHRETDLAVVQCVAEIAALVNPSRGDRRKRHPGEWCDFAVPFGRSRISQDRNVRSVRNWE